MTETVIRSFEYGQALLIKYVFPAGLKNLISFTCFFYYIKGKVHVNPLLPFNDSHLHNMGCVVTFYLVRSAVKLLFLVGISYTEICSQLTAPPPDHRASLSGFASLFVHGGGGFNISMNLMHSTFKRPFKSFTSMVTTSAFVSLPTF